MKTTKPRAGDWGDEMTSGEMTHLKLVSVRVGVSVRCGQLMHEVRPDFFATPRSMQRQGCDLRV